MKILLADDQELVLLSLEKSLIMLGYTVIRAQNVTDAKNMYDFVMPDLVIADLNMPYII
jgi:DNA-binding response OmpR family regulator